MPCRVTRRVLLCITLGWITLQDTRSGEGEGISLSVTLDHNLMVRFLNKKISLKHKS